MSGRAKLAPRRTAYAAAVEESEFSMIFVRQNSDGFAELQKEHSHRAERERFGWLTTNPTIAALEEALLRPLAQAIGPGASLLEVGCGEAANLATLRRLGFSGRYTGCDFSIDKTRFTAASADAVVAADALRLPFVDGSFDEVLCRDVLHHVPDRAAAIRELLRVAARRVWIIEPNPQAPVILGFAVLSRAERGMLDSAPKRLLSLVRELAEGWDLRVTFAEPQNLARMACHYQFGLPALGRVASAQRAWAALHGLAEKALPHAVWCYQVVELARRGVEAENVRPAASNR